MTKKKGVLGMFFAALLRVFGFRVEPVGSHPKLPPPPEDSGSGSDSPVGMEGVRSYTAFVPYTTLERGARWVFDLRPREHGCKSSDGRVRQLPKGIGCGGPRAVLTPHFLSGVWDEWKRTNWGFILEAFAHVRRIDGSTERLPFSLFDEAGRRVDSGLWVPPVVQYGVTGKAEQQAVCIGHLGWNGSVPAIPPPIKAKGQQELSCGDRVLSVDLHVTLKALDGKKLTDVWSW